VQARDDPVEYPLLHACSFLLGAGFEQCIWNGDCGFARGPSGFRLPETILLIDGIPNSMGDGGSVTGEPFGVFNQVDIFTLGRGLQEAEVGVPVVASR